MCRVIRTRSYYVSPPVLREPSPVVLAHEAEVLQIRDTAEILHPTTVKRTARNVKKSGN